MTDFASFIAPFDAAAFRAQHFGKRPVHIRRAAPGPAALSWQRFNEVLGLTPYWNEDTLKVFFKNRAALRDNYCDTTDLRPGARAPTDPAKVKALLGLGASLIANHVHRVCPEVASIAQMLEREFAARVAANVYCSFKGVQAFQTHFDLHDVFAVQMEGEKTWRVYESRADAPVMALPPGEEIEKWLTASRGKLLFEAEMKPGDILYLPRGQYHDALTGAQASLHVSFGVTPSTGLALFKLLETAVTAESAFRQYLPDARNAAELQQRLATLAQRVQAVMTSPAFATDVLNHQRGLAGTRAEFELPAQVPATWYSVARRAQVVRRDSGYVAVTDQGEIALGATHPTVEWILRQRLFSLGDALARHASTDPAELRAVLAQLTAAGVIVETEMRSEGLA
ncbi:MAG TPA: cupin domain-containing protein [Steroidobacteraceae bacterium]|nr:cupin domain-containing protein [Steroidobacteraceae bacterium]